MLKVHLIDNYIYTCQQISQYDFIFSRQSLSFSFFSSYKLNNLFNAIPLTLLAQLLYLSIQGRSGGLGPIRLNQNIIFIFLDIVLNLNQSTPNIIYTSMSNQQTKLFQTRDRLEFTATTKLLCKSQNVTSHNSKPQKRYGHLSFIYKSKLYVIGGCLVDNKNQPVTNADLRTSIYSYSLQKERTLATQDKKTKKTTQQTDVKWELVQAKIAPQAEADFNLFSYSAHCIFPQKKRLYIFGGSTPQGKTSGHLFRLDLDSLQWSKPEQKGTAPKAREESFLSLYSKSEKNYLVLYGGANYETYELFGDINFYQIETKYWFQCHNLSHNFIQPRISPGVCFNENKIYIFGGYYLNAQNNKGYFNDMYEIEFSMSVEKGRPYGRSFAKRLDEIFPYESSNEHNHKPEKRCASTLTFCKNDFSLTSHQKQQFKVGSQWLVLVGGQKSCDEKKKLATTLNDIWIFSLNELKWRNVTILTQFKSRCSSSVIYDKEISKFFLFGGLSSLEAMQNDLISVKINAIINEEIQEEGNEEKNEILENHNNFQDESLLNGQAIQDYFISQICNTITFPYSAINLIIDNFVNFQAKFCDITYHISKSRNLSQNYIKFESNATFPMTNEAMVSHFLCLKGGIRTYVQGTDKKIKAEMNKDNLQKEVGTHFVVGGLRLGNQIVFINFNPQTFEIQIFIILQCHPNHYSEHKMSERKQSNENTFRLFSFLIMRQEILSDDVLASTKNAQEARKRKYFLQKMCPIESRDRMRTIIVQGINSIKKGVVKNILYVSKLRTVEGSQCTQTTHESSLQIFPDMMRNDIIFGDRQVICDIDVNTKIPIYHCMDVSLRTYMSYIYSQNLQTEITLSIQGLERKQILMQDYLLKVDQLLKSQEIADLTEDFEFDCKIVELYHFRNDGSQQEMHSKLTNGSSKIELSKFFAHGTLFYHKNRLVKRHPIDLGDFLQSYQLAKIKQQHNSQKSIILKSSSHYSATQIFGHIQLPEAVPMNLTKTDFVFPVMLQKIDQRLRLLGDQVRREKQKKQKKLTQVTNGFRQP